MSDLTKLTVNLVPRSVDALEGGAGRGGTTKTDAVNRALQLYAAVMDAIDLGGAELTVDLLPGTVTRIIVQPPEFVERRNATVRLGTIASWFVHLTNGPDPECYWCYRRAVRQLRRKAP